VGERFNEPSPLRGLPGSPNRSEMVFVRRTEITRFVPDVYIRDLHGKFSAGMPRETAGNTAGAGIKFPTIPRDGNLIGENPAVAVGRIASRPAGDKTRIATLRYGPITNAVSSQCI